MKPEHARVNQQGNPHRSLGGRLTSNTSPRAITSRRPCCVRVAFISFIRSLMLFYTRSTATCSPSPNCYNHRLPSSRSTKRHLRLLIVAITLLVCVAAVAAQTTTVTVAPMQMRGWMPVVEVKLNGQGPFAFMIDTGAGMQADIDTSVAERLNLQPSGKAINGDPSGENDREVATVTIDSIMIGGVAKGTRARRTGEGVVEFRNVTAIMRPHKITKDYPEVDGILGFALFSDYLLTLDYPAMQVTLARGALPPANGADILTLEIENRVPIVELAIGKIIVPAHIDSGNFECENVCAIC